MPERMWSMTDEEVRTIKSMALYWVEISQREDQEPLHHEVQTAYAKFGTKILWALKYYAETEPNHKT